jgi:hypothetical protein
LIPYRLIKVACLVDVIRRCWRGHADRSAGLPEAHIVTFMRQRTAIVAGLIIGPLLLAFGMLWLLLEPSTETIRVGSQR